jgi:hypothetical protein
MKKRNAALVKVLKSQFGYNPFLTDIAAETHSFFAKRIGKIDCGTYRSWIPTPQPGPGSTSTRRIVDGSKQLILAAS